VGQTCGKTGDLLDRPGEGDRHRAHRGVEAVGRVHGAVRHAIDLVELRVHTIDRPSGLVDQGEHLFLQTLDQRRNVRDGCGQTDKHVREREPDESEEGAEGDPEDVERLEVREGHRAILRQ
jgi:hypothetical protein